MMAIVLCLFSGKVSAAETNTTWSYESNGTDWTMGNCGLKNYPQAPLNITNDDPATNLDWLPYHWEFLPSFKSGEADSYGFDNWVYMLKSNQSAFGGYYATEPVAYTNNRAVYWDVYEVRFHYPAENLINGTQYDLEMQIFGYDLYDRHFICTQKKGALSVFFNVDDTLPENDFFSWQANATAGEPISVDFDKVVTKITGSTSDITGYRGTDSMPDCAFPICWWIIQTPQTCT
jgi:hypothetical protein